MNIFSIIGMLTAGAALLFVLLAILEVGIFYVYAARLVFTVKSRDDSTWTQWWQQRGSILRRIHYYAWNEVDYVQGPGIGRVYWSAAIRQQYEKEEEAFESGE